MECTCLVVERLVVVALPDVRGGDLGGARRHGDGCGDGVGAVLGADRDLGEIRAGLGDQVDLQAPTDGVTSLFFWSIVFLIKRLQTAL